MGNECGAHIPFLILKLKINLPQIEHEATTVKNWMKIKYFIVIQEVSDTEKAIALIVKGFSKEVLQQASNGVCS